MVPWNRGGTIGSTVRFGSCAAANGNDPTSNAVVSAAALCAETNWFELNEAKE
jgi:hypothetical protein